MAPKYSNDFIASQLDNAAALLEKQHQNRYRILAYRRGARIIREQRSPIADIIRDEGIDGLTKIRGIGPWIAYGIVQIAATGTFDLLKLLEAKTRPLRVIDDENQNCDHVKVRDSSKRQQFWRDLRATVQFMKMDRETVDSSVHPRSAP